MATQWYFMGSSWLRKSRRVGPITESDLLARIDKGQIVPDTLVKSSKTKNKWVPMSKVGPAMKRYCQQNPEAENPE